MKNTENLEKNNQTLESKAYLHIKEQIMSYKLKPGEILSEIELTRRLSMSRTPIHQALLHLQREGFVEYLQGLGWRVYSLSLKDIMEIFDVKIVVERIIMNEVALREASSKDQIRKCIEKMRNAAKKRDLDEWIKLDHELHDQILVLASNSRAISIINQLNEQLYRFHSRYPPLDLAQRQHDHDIIVDCILNGDAEGAKKNNSESLIKLRDEMEYVLYKIIFPLTDYIV
jgi:DNA-binding GntR family transcriptional regulator